LKNIIKIVLDNYENLCYYGIMKNENLICLRYGRDGHLLSRLELETMISILGLYNKTEDIFRKLMAGHCYTLDVGGGWLELENRHV
jgi:hypothetical protein